VGTVIGTPPIAQYAAYTKVTTGHAVTFLSWLRLGLPVLAVVLALTWVVLTRVAFRVPTGAIPGVREQIAAQRRGLGPWSAGAVLTVAVFALAAVAWVGVPLLARAPFLAGTGAAGVLARTTDASIAIAATILLFVLPVDARRGEFVMDWREGRKVPWGILLLFGGGLSLATALTAHGVDAYIASLAGPLHHVPLLVVLIALSLAAIVLTEFASNTALVAAGLPVAGAIAERLGLPPAVLLVTVTLSASLGFMLPGGTAPNALVFASGRVTMRQMMKAGLWLDVACSLGVPFVVYGAYRLGLLPGM
jgi:sodium-dependent dicarboxylate transporter 2/3/5